MTSMAWPLAWSSNAFAARPVISRPGRKTAGSISPITSTFVRLVTSFSGSAPAAASAYQASCRVMDMRPPVRTTTWP